MTDTEHFIRSIFFSLVSYLLDIKSNKEKSDNENYL